MAISAAEGKDVGQEDAGSFSSKWTGWVFQLQMDSLGYFLEMYALLQFQQGR